MMAHWSGSKKALYIMKQTKRLAMHKKGNENTCCFTSSSLIYIYGYTHINRLERFSKHKLQLVTSIK